MMGVYAEDFMVPYNTAKCHNYIKLRVCLFIPEELLLHHCHCAQCEAVHEVPLECGLCSTT